MSNSKLSILKQFWGFMRANKKFWLLPFILILVGFGFLIVFAQSSAFAPLIYAIF